MASIEQMFSDWLLETTEKRHDMVVRQGGLTVDALNWIQGSNYKAVENGMMKGIPVTLLLNDAFLAGVTFGFMFREHLAQMEELPL